MAPAQTCALPPLDPARKPGVRGVTRCQQTGTRPIRAAARPVAAVIESMVAKVQWVDTATVRQRHPLMTS